ncbi:hypothetical protein NEHOM01_0932 [Nematocida homosporus]|uniref:uncharacterized protein n=1 Tax=Nematocida homosporus TaxID=1912981 RepID=UPI00221EB610|nr:uncharacterized protein NEHOM01_0932 [Nematocida homosporus]KAI5185606.1 hypothetical protein NEHOM01_0932 [Nematocida homosporus]
MHPARKRSQRHAKLSKEANPVIEFDPEERENYLKAQSKRRITARRKRKLQEEEEKRESQRQKNREHKQRQKDQAELAQRVREAAIKKEETQTQIGNSIVTIKEL